MDPVFSTYGNYYDLLYKDKDYLSETRYINTLLNKYGNNGQKIIEFGSGTGKHAALLNKLGYTVVGIEPSVEMLAQAEKLKNEQLDFICSNIEEYQTSKKFDAALALFHVVSYINNSVTLLKAFKNVYHTLVEDGVFIFDVWYSPAVINLRPQSRTKIIEDEHSKLKRVAIPQIEWNTNIVEVQYHIDFLNKTNNEKSKFTELHKMRHFSVPEIELLSMASGFKLLHFEEFFTGNEASETTWGICFVLKK